jgi:hypothetical protein
MHGQFGCHRHTDRVAASNTDLLSYPPDSGFVVIIAWKTIRILADSLMMRPMQSKHQAHILASQQLFERQKDGHGNQKKILTG